MSGPTAGLPYGQMGGSSASGRVVYPSDAQIRAQHAIMDLQSTAELRERMVRLVADRPSTFGVGDTASILAEAERLVQYVLHGPSAPGK